MEIKQETRICKNCGKEFKVFIGNRKTVPKGFRGKNTVTCSHKCSGGWNHNLPRRVEYNRLRRKKDDTI